MPETTMTWQSIAPAIPEIYLVAAICALLLVDVFAGQTRHGLTPTLTLIALAVGAGLTVLYANVTQRTILFDGMYVADELAYVLKLFGFLFVAFGLLYSRDYLEERGIQRGEYYVLVMTALLGIFVLVSANSMLTVYIGVELLALSVYAMAAFDRDCTLRRAFRLGIGQQESSPVLRLRKQDNGGDGFANGQSGGQRSDWRRHRCRRL